MKQEHQAILLVSFGTSYTENRIKTIDRIEIEIRERFPAYTVYHAWTSKMIIKKLWQRDAIRIPTVLEAMEQIVADGISSLIVQPTHVIDGIENDRMKEDVTAFSERFDTISFGTPLLDSRRDMETVAQVLHNHLGPAEDTALVIMGHGSAHQANQTYTSFADTVTALGHDRTYVATVEAYPELADVLPHLHTNSSINKVVLTPLMVTAGDHANNDMAGPGEGSWTSILKHAGFNVTPVIRGLGEYPEIRELFCRHLSHAGAIENRQPV